MVGLGATDHGREEAHSRSLQSANFDPASIANRRRLTLASPESPPTGHGRDTGKFSKYKSLILLALPRELEPLFSP